MTLGELLNSLNDEEFVLLEKIFHENKSPEMVNCFHDLKNRKPKQLSEEDKLMTIFMEEVKDDEFGDYVDVYGKDGTLRKELEDYKKYIKDKDKTGELGNVEEHWALDFTPWDKWLSYKISDKALEEYGKELVIYYCLYEMTAWGNEANMTQIKEELVKRVDDLKNMTDEELNEYTYTHEEVLDMFKEDK